MKLRHLFNTDFITVDLRKRDSSILVDLRKLPCGGDGGIFVDPTTCAEVTK